MEIKKKFVLCLGRWQFALSWEEPTNLDHRTSQPYCNLVHKFLFFESFVLA